MKIMRVEIIDRPFYILAITMDLDWMMTIFPSQWSYPSPVLEKVEFDPRTFSPTWKTNNGRGIAFRKSVPHNFGRDYSYTLSLEYQSGRLTFKAAHQMQLIVITHTKRGGLLRN